MEKFGKAIPLSLNKTQNKVWDIATYILTHIFALHTTN